MRPPAMLPLSFIHAGGDHGDAKNVTSGLIFWISFTTGRICWRSGSIEKCPSSVSPATSS